MTIVILSTFVATVVIALVATAAMVEPGRAARAEIMRMLADGQWHHGFDLVAASQRWRRSFFLPLEGAIDRTTIYIHLAVLEKRGLVESRFEPPAREGHLPRRLYRVSPDRGRPAVTN